jgi:hypothetical protein
MNAISRALEQSRYPAVLGLGSAAAARNCVIGRHSLYSPGDDPVDPKWVHCIVYTL